jgi:uncharacterized protein (TIGR00299 family) protein
MHLGALLDIGVPAEHLATELNRLELADEFTLRVEPASKMGITGTRASVDLHPDAKTPHRHLRDIQQIIEGAQYDPAVRDRALEMFREIAVAEAKVHGTTIDAVHFHEVGATDSIVDIVGAAIGLEFLNVDTLLCNALELGGGMVKCAHGVFPVPAPATAEILKDVPCRYGGVDSEATTPTGAAILKANIDRFGPPDGFVSERIGYGIGQKDFAIPNVLRVMLGSVTTGVDTDSYLSEINVEVSANIDDMSPEAFQPLMDRLFACGAKDVFLTPIMMKKSRPATKVTVLADPDRLAEVTRALVMGSTTLGVRVHQVTKHMLPREVRTVQTSFGEVRVKYATRPDGTVNWKVEHDDLVDLAARHERDYLGLKSAIDAEVRAQLDTDS